MVVPGTRNETPTNDSPNAEIEAMANADSGCSRARCKSQFAASLIQAKKPCIVRKSEVEGGGIGSKLTFKIRRFPGPMMVATLSTNFELKRLLSGRCRGSKSGFLREFR